MSAANLGGDDPAGALVDGRNEFQAALREAIEALARSDCREVWFCDRNFLDWPLGEPPTLDLLSRWAFPHRRLVVVAADFEPLARRHPRWVVWRRRFAHVVSCRRVDAADADSIPCMFLAPPSVGVELHDAPRWRGRRATAAADFVAMRSELEAFLQRSQESFPATTLGL